VAIGKHRFDKRVQARPLDERVAGSHALLEISGVNASASRTTIERHAPIRFPISIRSSRIVRIASPAVLGALRNDVCFYNNTRN